MPEGYTYKALVGAIKNSSGNFTTMRQLGKNCVRVSAAALIGGTETSATEINLASYVPPTAKVVHGWALASKAGATEIVLTVASDSGLNFEVGIGAGGASGTIQAMGAFSLPLLTAQKIYYALSASSANANINVTGWEY